MKAKEVKAIKSKLLEKTSMQVVDYANGLSTGSTLLNLACSDRSGVGFLPGKYYFIVGDSASGKTFLSLTCLAEAALNNNFDKHRFIYDNAEDGALMDVKKFFGKAVADRVESPALLDGPVYSSTVEEFFYHIDDAFDVGKPFIYILDSMDALGTEEENEKFQAQKDAHEKGKEVSGSYGTSKAKANSAGIRRLLHKLSQSGSILIIISQTRDNIGSFSFEKKTRSGGHALRFYATLEMWSSIKEKIKKTVTGHPRQIGVTCLVKVKKNRMTGKERVVEIPIYHSFGMDDIGSCVAWLIEEKHWSKAGGVVTADEFKFKGSEEDLIAKIETDNEEKKLKLIVSEAWQDIESQCEVSRKKRYV